MLSRLLYSLNMDLMIYRNYGSKARELQIADIVPATFLATCFCYMEIINKLLFLPHLEKYLNVALSRYNTKYSLEYLYDLKAYAIGVKVILIPLALVQLKLYLNNTHK